MVNFICVTFPLLGQLTKTHLADGNWAPHPLWQQEFKRSSRSLAIPPSAHKLQKGRTQTRRCLLRQLTPKRFQTLAARLHKPTRGLAYALVHKFVIFVYGFLKNIYLIGERGF